MAILQISRIQVRRGLQQDLPLLASGEFGWSIDKRRLFIGNGTLDEGAPSLGVTEILTQYTDFTNITVSYEFSGLDTGYISQTGPTVTTPVNRTLQSVLDERVSVRDFGTFGDGITDDTAAILRCFQQIYVDNLYTGLTSVRRTIYFPAGTYLISRTLPIPPYATLIGDGKDNTVIVNTDTVLQTADNNFATDISMGLSNAVLPTSIYVSGMTLQCTAGSDPVVNIDSVSDMTFENVGFVGISSVSQLVSVKASVATPTNVSLINCTFSGQGCRLGLTSTTPVRSLTIIRCAFENMITGIAITPDMVGVSAMNNYFTGVMTPIQNISGANYVLANTSADADISGLQMGLAKQGIGKSLSLTPGNNTIISGSLPLGSGVLDYEISDVHQNYRHGSLRYVVTPSGSTYEDEYTEPLSPLPAILSLSNVGILNCQVTSNSATLTFKFNQKQFV